MEKNLRKMFRFRKCPIAKTSKFLFSATPIAVRIAVIDQKSSHSKTAVCPFLTLVSLILVMNLGALTGVGVRWISS